MKLKNWLYIFMLLPFLWSCNDEDDIDAIFISGTWDVRNFFTGGDWDKTNDGARPVYTKEEDFKVLNQMTVSFLPDGSVQGKTANGTFSANWEADGKGRTVLISNIKTSTAPTGKSKQLIEALTNARFYKGDSNYLKLAPEDRKTYVQLGHELK